MKTIKVKIFGIKPLLMHNVRLANPLDIHAQKLAEVTKKRSKTTDDYQLISKLEFEGGIYFDADEGPYLPDGHLMKCICDGGKKEKLGKAMRSSVFVRTPINPLIYDGPRDVKGLYKAGFYDMRCIGVNQSKTVRTRPRFNTWAVAFDVEYDETLVDAINVRRAIEHAGKVEGIGDYRPRFGTFELETFNG